MRIKFLRHVNPVLGMNTTFQSIVGTAIITLLSSPAFCTDSPPVRSITAGECVEAALRNNIDIAVSWTEREIAEQRVPIEEAAFLPRFKGRIGEHTVLIAERAVALALTLLRHIDARINAGAATSMDRLPAEATLAARPAVGAFGQRVLQVQRQETVAKHRTLPAVDLTSSAGLTGLAGTPNTNPL